MALIDLVTADVQEPTLQVTLDGRALDALSAEVDMGYDSVSLRASVALPEIPSWNRFDAELLISMGYSGLVQPVGRAWIEDDDRAHELALDNTIVGAGELRRAQYQARSPDTSYSNYTDTTFVSELLRLSGVTSKDIQGADLDLATLRPSGAIGGGIELVLKENEAPWDKINEVDQVTGFFTFDAPLLVMRRFVSGVPAASAAFSFVEGTGPFRARRTGTKRGIHNRVVVYGLPQATGRPGYYYQADNPLVSDPPKYITYEFSSDLIETTAIANNVARRLIGEQNRATEDIELVIPGNPFIIPTMTVALTWPSLKINSATNYFVKHVTHQFDPSGYTTTLIITGGLGNVGDGGVIPSPAEGGTIGTQPSGDVGDPGDGTGPGSGPGSGGNPTGGTPIAQFVTKTMRETYDVSGTPTDMYTIFADATTSVDTDTPPGGLTYSWSNNTNSDVGTGRFYSTKLTQAEFEAGCVITLLVTDGNGDTDTVTKTIIPSAETVMVRDLYVAANESAEASADGGKTWNTWTPSSGTVISTPEIAGNISYYGLSDGKLYYTTDRLATAPTLAHTFGDRVETIWINENDANRVTVGLGNGEAWQTTDAGSVASATWTLLYTHGAAVLRIVESFEAQGELRAAVGDAILISNDNGASWTTLIQFSGGATARAIALSFFTNYGSATVSSGETDAVQTEGGTSITFPAATPAVEDVWALTHHIREDVLYAADDDGAGLLRSWTKESGASVFTASATAADAGAPNHMIRDGDNHLTHYIAADEGLYKTFDGFASIVRLRDYSTGTLIGRQVGYGSISAISVAGGGSGGGSGDPPTGGGGGGGGGSTGPIEIVSAVGEGLTLSNGTSRDGPAGWTEIGFDDSAWSAPVAQGGAIYGTFPVITGTAWITYLSGDAPDDGIWLYRRTFSVPSGAVTSAVLQIWVDNDMPGVWINNIFVVADNSGSMSDTGPLTFTVPLNVILPGQTNCIAVMCHNKNEPSVPINPTSLDYKLVIE